MTEKSFRKAQDLIKSKDTLDKFWRIICKPFPEIFHNRRIFWGYEYREISFASFDETTREELREAIKNVIEKRSKEIDKELEVL